MLQLRPNCEACDRDLPPDAPDAMICSFECTFCRECVDAQLHNVCPNCGGGFTLRPVRPAGRLAANPPSDKRVGPRLDRERHSALLAKYRDVPPQQR